MKQFFIYLLACLTLTGCVNAQDVTPAQQEGPYYPVEFLPDRDSDLTQVAGQAQVAEGELLLLSGRVLRASGGPVENATVEVWQTDSGGAYMHPRDPATAERDLNFQFYGEALTAADGSYSFRTILPGQYEPRPRHIHFKVKLDGNTLLTSQFYFSGYEGAPPLTQPEMLNVNLTKVEDDSYASAYSGAKDIVVAD